MQMLGKKIFYLIMIYGLSNSFGCSVSNKDKKAAVDSKLPRIAWFIGEVSAEKDGIKRGLNLGDTLAANDSIITGKNGNLEVMVGNGILKIAKNTRLSVQSLINDQGSDVKVNLNYGKVVSVVKKENKDSNFSVITPTTIAGIRGTTFLTSVEKPGKEGVACDKDCVIEYAVIEGSIAVKKIGSDKEIILEKNTQAILRRDSKFNKNMVKSLNKESLKKLKEMVVFHKNDVMGYSRLIDDLRSNSEELRQFEVSGGIEESKERLSNIETIKSTDEVTKTAQTSDAKYIKKNANKEYLKLEAEKENNFK